MSIEEPVDSPGGGGGGGGGGNFETVNVTGERKIDVNDGENISNVLYVLDGPNAKPRIHMNGASSVVNVGFKNECQNSGDGGMGIKIITSGQALIENVYLGDGCVPGHICPMFANKSSSGSVTIRNVNIQDFPDNAAYTDPPGSGGGAEMHFERCFFARCTSGVYRLSKGSLSECVALINAPGARAKLREKDRGPGKPEGSRISAGRGIWGRRNADVVAENCLFHMPHESGKQHAKTDSDGSTVTMRNCMLGGLPEDDWADGNVSFPGCTQWSPGDGVPWNTGGATTETVMTDGGGVPAPPGIPLTPEEAAGGTASADGTTVPPGGKSLPGGSGGSTSGGGSGGVGGAGGGDGGYGAYNYAGSELGVPFEVPVGVPEEEGNRYV